LLHHKAWRENPWQSPGSEFLAELRGLIERNIQQEEAKIYGMQRKQEMDQDSDYSGSNHHVQWDEDVNQTEFQKAASDWHTKDNRPLHKGSLFEPGFERLRQLHMDGSDRTQVVGNHSLCMYTSKSKQDLYSAMIDELSFHTNVQSPPPPLFIQMCGSLPVATEVPWPVVLQGSHLHVIGSVQGLATYREQVSPTLSVLDWAAWLENYADDHISAKISRHLVVPWS